MLKTERQDFHSNIITVSLNVFALMSLSFPKKFNYTHCAIIIMHIMSKCDYM